MCLHCIICSSYYEPGAVMLDEDSHVIGGLLLGLNVIDFNFNIKDQTLDEPVRSIILVVHSCFPLDSINGQSITLAQASIYYCVFGRWAS